MFGQEYWQDTSQYRKPCNGVNDELHIDDDGITRVCDDYAVMRKWEEPMMRKYAEIVTQNGGDILEIGFGMGLSATKIQENSNVTSHTIVEVHDQIVKEAFKFQEKHENVEVIHANWYDAFHEGDLLEKKFDGVFYDAEFDKNYHLFPKLCIQYFLKPGGIFSWYNSVNGKANTWAIECNYESYKVPDFPEYAHGSNKDNPNSYQKGQINYIPIVRKGE